MTQIADIQAQIQALKAQAKELALAERKAVHTAEVALRKEDRKIEREFVRAMKAEFLARDRAEAKAAQRAAKAVKQEQVAAIRAQLAAVGLTVRDLRTALTAEAA